IEEVFLKYNNIESISDLIDCFPKYKLEEKLTQISRRKTILQLEDTEEKFELEGIVNFFSYQILYKIFHVLYIEIEDNYPFIAFYIPHNQYATWIKGEFRETVGEFSGRKGNLSSSVNRKA